MNRIMALDMGEKRIGVAISDALGITAQPFKVIESKGLNRDIDVLNNIAKENSVSRIVVGMPYNIKGETGSAAEKVLKFIDVLRKKTGVEVDEWDERFSTSSTERLLIEAGLSRSRRKTVIDKLAAAVILQGYLDMLNLQGKEK